MISWLSKWISQNTKFIIIENFFCWSNTIFQTQRRNFLIEFQLNDFVFNSIQKFKAFSTHCTRKYHIWWVKRKLKREGWCIELTQMLCMKIKCLESTHCVALSTQYVLHNILSSFDFVGKVNIYSPLSGLVATLPSYKKGRNCFAVLLDSQGSDHEYNMCILLLIFVFKCFTWPIEKMLYRK